MDGDFANGECTVRYPASALICKVVASRCPLVHDAVRGVELAFGEVFQTPVV